MISIDAAEPRCEPTPEQLTDAGEQLLQQHSIFADAVENALRYQFRGYEGDVTCDAREVKVTLISDALPPLRVEVFRTDWQPVNAGPDDGIVATVQLVAKDLEHHFRNGRDEWTLTYLVAECD